MASYDFVIADVFTEERFGGNQLAVLPEAAGLEASQMQRIAREFNFAETTFVFPPADPRNARRVRIFTPKVELPFAGHPTVGTAAILAHIGVLDVGRPYVLEEGIGPVVVEVSRSNNECIHSRFTIRPNMELRPGNPARRVIADVLSISANDVVDTWSASAGFPFCFAHLGSQNAVDRATINHTAWLAELSSAWARDVFFFSGDFQPEGHLYARMFGPGVGIPEDPATGSACAALIGVLAGRQCNENGKATIVVHQGVAMGRPSVIQAAADIENGTIVNVQIGGSSVIVARGSIAT